MVTLLLIDVLTMFRVISNADLFSSYITKNTNFLDLYAVDLPVLTTASLCQRVITQLFIWNIFKNNRSFFSLLGEWPNTYCLLKYTEKVIKIDETMGALDELHLHLQSQTTDEINFTWCKYSKIYFLIASSVISNYIYLFN